jgi:ribosomal protein L36
MGSPSVGLASEKPRIKNCTVIKKINDKIFVLNKK